MFGGPAQQVSPEAMQAVVVVGPVVVVGAVRLQQDLGGGVGGGFRGEGVGVAGTPGGGGSLGEVLPGGRVEHSGSLLPLTPGLFKLVVSAQVQFRDRPHAWRLAPVNVMVNI